METISSFWFNPDNEQFWFKQSNDQDNYIYNNYYQLLNETKDDNIEEYTLEKVILFDQFSRHIYRNNPDKYKSYQKYAIVHSMYLLNNKSQLDKLAPKQRVFILLPFRHTFLESMIKYSILKVKEWMKDNNSSYYKRFLVASYNSLGKVINKKYEFGKFNYLKNIEYKSDLILENNKKLKNFNVFRDTNIPKKFLENVKDINCKNICISLSGGVDSVICLILFKYLTDKNIFAVHIDYNQRNESIYEAKFVQHLCNENNIPLLIRNIYEIKKTKENRTIYEDITKNIRFDLYYSAFDKFKVKTEKDFINTVNFNLYYSAFDKLKVEAEKDRIIVLGHHNDDAFENILNNMKKNINNNNLRGFLKLKEINNVKILRPLFNVSKSEIFDFAHSIGVSYLKDITRVETERGNIRNNIAPILGNKYIEGIMNFADEHKEMYETIINNLAKPFLDKMEWGNSTIKLPEFKDITSYIFWKYVIYSICFKIDHFPPSNRSILAFIEKIKVSKTNNIKRFYFKSDLVFEGDCFSF